MWERDATTLKLICHRETHSVLGYIWLRPLKSLAQLVIVVAYYVDILYPLILLFPVPLLMPSADVKDRGQYNSGC